MTASLLLHIPELPRSFAESSGHATGDDIHCFSRIVSDSETDSESAQWQSHTLKETPKDLNVYVFIPSLHILSTQVQAPKKQQKHLAQILPFLCEEKLACDIEDVHIAAGKIQGDDIPVRIIQRSLLNDVLHVLASVNIQPQGLYADSEPLLAHTHQDETTLWIDQQRSVLADQQKVISLKTSQAVDLLTALKDRSPQTVTLYRNELATTTSIDQTALNLQIEELKSQGIEVTENTLPDHSELMPAFERQGFTTDPTQSKPNSTQTYTNLLTGPYTPLTQSANHFRWQPWALAASILIGINLAYLLGSGLYFNLQTQTYRENSEQLYKEYFPQDRRIINIQTQTKNHLAGGQQHQNSGFLLLLSQFMPSWEKQKNELHIKSLRYNQQRKEILMDIESKTIAQLDQLQQSLGEHAELLSANEDNSKGVRGRLKIQGGR